MPLSLPKIPKRKIVKKKMIGKKRGRKTSSRQQFLKVFMKELSGQQGSATIDSFVKGDKENFVKLGARMFSNVALLMPKPIVK